MDKILAFFTLMIYLLIISYISSMVVFDFKKYILKDKILKNMKFSFNWKEKYNYIKALEDLKIKLKSDKLKIFDDVENSNTSK